MNLYNKIVCFLICMAHLYILLWCVTIDSFCYANRRKRNSWKQVSLFDTKSPDRKKTFVSLLETNSIEFFLSVIEKYTASQNLLDCLKFSLAEIFLLFVFFFKTVGVLLFLTSSLQMNAGKFHRFQKALANELFR